MGADAPLNLEEVDRAFDKAVRGLERRDDQGVALPLIEALRSVYDNATRPLREPYPEFPDGKLYDGAVYLPEELLEALGATGNRWAQVSLVGETLLVRLGERLLGKDDWDPRGVEELRARLRRDHPEIFTGGTSPVGTSLDGLVGLVKGDQLREA